MIDPLKCGSWPWIS